MRKIAISATAVAGVAAVSLLALPIASAFASDDVDVKRDEDTPSLTTVLDDDLDGADPTGPTNGPTDGPTNPPTNDVTNDVTNGVTNGVTNDVTNDVTQGPTNDATDDASRDD